MGKELTLEEVDVIQLKALQASLDGIENIFPTQTVLVDVAIGISVCRGAVTFPRRACGSEMELLL